MSKINDGGPADYWEVPLTTGGHAVVDAADRDRVSQYLWRRGRNGYIYCVNHRRSGYSLLHRFILEAPVEKEVHHRDENQLNNTRGNLELIDGPDHRRLHIGPLSAANERRRIHPTHRACEWCGETYSPDQDHRGVSRFCSRSCANKHNRRCGMEVSRG